MATSWPGGVILRPVLKLVSCDAELLLRMLLRSWLNYVSFSWMAANCGPQHAHLLTMAANNTVANQTSQGCRLFAGSTC
jgi:hypothetical protein